LNALTARAQSHIAWLSFGLSLLVTVLMLVSSVRLDLQATAALQMQRALIASASARTSGLAVRRSANPNQETMLPANGDSDPLIRWASKIASEQGVTLVQIQTEAAKPDSKHLGQIHAALRLRGEYPAIKVVLISLLDKFSGLTLEHLTIRHRMSVVSNAGAATTPDRSDDEATIEMIQYSKAPQAAQ
jgi:hypothetical protein